MAIQPTLQPRQDRLGKLLTVGGALIGAQAGPQGALMGAGAGQTAAGLLQRPRAQSIETAGMSRRQQALAGDPVRAIAEAQAALQTLPPEQFPETRRAFQDAMALAQRNQQIGRV
jgi:hypothetical protein